MRREGYEFAVSRPEVILRQDEDGLYEPVERLFVEVQQDFFGAVSEMLGRRRALLQNIQYGDDGTVYAEFLAPTRGILGMRQPFLTATRGTGIFNALFHGYEPYSGDIDVQDQGS
ncbi:MAG: translational GTPase TypA, partial [Anaerolineales bacterium]|nr:translational GTPase TypA [Anaerolineales bacterium]